jgi:surface protein
MDVVTMKLVERTTILPLDLVVLINSFLSEKLIDKNFHFAITLWFENNEECVFRFGHISYWNTSRVTNMKRTFTDRRDFNEDVSHWNVGRVTDMSGMFCRATEFNGDIGCWDVSSVTSMRGMFNEATQFNGDIDHWNVSSVTNMSGMFCRATEFNRDIGHWNSRI